MPLFMDFHQLDNITVEDVKKAHIADLQIQEKYGVKYHQYWVNPVAGSVFCLVEGPDKETCELVHNIAHGNIACALTEVEPGFFKTLMGADHHLDDGHVKRKDGDVDLGYRNILVLSLRGKLEEEECGEQAKIGVPAWARQFVSRKIAAFSGREMKWETDDSIIGIFDDASHAVLCALHLQDQLLQAKEGFVRFRMGLSAAQPVTNDGVFFTQAIQLAHRLCKTAGENGIMISSLLKKICPEDVVSPASGVKTLDAPTEDFVSNLFENIENARFDNGLTIPSLSHRLGISQPQFYRKIVSITGRAPNDFLRDLRLEKGLSLLQDRAGNVAQVAMEVGYSNPSYFARCFAKKFGCTPSLV